VQSACNATTTGHRLNKHTIQRPTINNPSSYFATLTGLGELHLKLQLGGGGPDHEVVHNAAELLSGISPYVQDTDGVFTSLASTVSRGEGTPVTILRQDS
jgi:hypothetical protein